MWRSPASIWYWEPEKTNTSDIFVSRTQYFSVHSRPVGGLLPVLAPRLFSFLVFFLFFFSVFVLTHCFAFLPLRSFVPGLCVLVWCVLEILFFAYEIFFFPSLSFLYCRDLFKSNLSFIFPAFSPSFF